MSRVMLLSLLGLAGLCTATAAPVPKQVARPTGILILDNCDEVYRGKDEYKDNLTLLNAVGKPVFRVSGFNNCESIGSSRMIAVDSIRKRIWTVENVGKRIRRFNFAGKETLSIPEVDGSAIAVDPETGNIWVLKQTGQVGQGRMVVVTAVFDETGKEIASYDIPGWDIVYDRKAKAFWIADKKLTKIVAATGNITFSIDVAVWFAVSVEVDPRTGAAWVAVREHPQVIGSSNRLLKFGPDGKELAAIELGPKSPFRVSVNSKDGSVWVARFMKGVLHCSADGKVETEHPVEALAVQVDPADGSAWIVTPSEVQKMTAKGEVTMRVKHAGRTSQAWIAAVE